MSRDTSHSAFQRQSKNTRIGIGLVHDRERHFSSRVGQKDHLSFGHPRPKRSVFFVVAVDVDHVGQQFQNAGSRFDATIQLIHGVGPPGVDGNGRNNFFMPFSQFEHDLVGNVKFRFFGQGRAIVGMGNVLSEQNEGIQA